MLEDEEERAVEVCNCIKKAARGRSFLADGNPSGRDQDDVRLRNKAMGRTEKDDKLFSSIRSWGLCLPFGLKIVVVPPLLSACGAFLFSAT